MEFQSSDAVRNKRTERLAEAGKRRLRRATTRPDAPRGVKLIDGTLTWEEPQQTANVTHYTIYAGDETVRVPVGNTMATGIKSELVFIAAYNEASDLESPREMATQTITEATPTAVVTESSGQGPSARLSLEDWDVVVGALGRNEQTAEQIARLDFTVNASFCSDHPDISVFGVWFYKSESDPLDPAVFIPMNCNQLRPASGPATWSTIVSRDLTDSTWWFMVIPQTTTFNSIPTLDDSFRALVVSAVAPPPKVENFAVEVIGPEDRGGASSGRFSLTWDTPNDPEYYNNHIERRRYTDNTYATPYPDAQGEWGEMGFSDAPYKTEWFPLGPEEFWKFRCRSASRSDRYSDYSDPINVHVPAATPSTGGITPPSSRLGSGDWTAVLGAVGRNDQTGEQLARFDFTVTAAFCAAHTDISYFSVYYAKGTAPALSEFVPLNANQVRPASGDAVWAANVSRDIADTTWWFLIVPHTPTYTSTPQAGDSMKSVLLTAVTPPPQVTGFSVTVVGPEDRGGVSSGHFRFTWTNPTSVEYYNTHIERRRYTDGTFSTPYPGVQGASWGELGFSDSSFDGGWFPLGAVEYWKFRWRTQSRTGMYSAYSSEVGVTVSAAAATAGTVPPSARLASGDWSVAVGALGRNTQTGENIARIDFTVNSAFCSAHADISYFSVYYAKATSPTLSQFVPLNANQVRPTDGSAATWSANVSRDPSDTTWWFLIVPHTPTYTSSPSASDAQKSVVVTAVSTPSGITGFTASVTTSVRGGIPWGKFKFTWTNPSDLEYYNTHIERRQCTDNTFATPVGAWGEVFFSDVAFEQPDGWALPKYAEYWQFRWRTQSRTGVYSAYSSAVNVTVPASSGIDAGVLDPSTLSPGLVIASDGRLAVNAGAGIAEVDGAIVSLLPDPSNMLLNPGAEYGLLGWGLWGTLASVVTSPVHTAGGKAFKFPPNQQGITQGPFPASAGDQIAISGWWKADTGTNGNANYIIFWYDKDGNALTPAFDAGVFPSSGLIAGWVHNTLRTQPAPAGTAKFSVLVRSDHLVTTGNLYVDDLQLFRMSKEIADAAVTLSKIKPGDLNSTIFADYGISNPQKLADGIVSRVGLFTDGVISRSAIIANATILDAHIQNMSLAKLLADTAHFTGTATFQSGTSGPYVQISSAGITMYNSSGGASVNISSNYSSFVQDLDIVPAVGSTYIRASVGSRGGGFGVTVHGPSYDVELDGTNGSVNIFRNSVGTSSAAYKINGMTGFTGIRTVWDGSSFHSVTISGGIITSWT